MNTYNTQINIAMQVAGDGAKKAGDDLAELEKKTKASEEAFKKMKEQAESAIKVLEGIHKLMEMYTAHEKVVDQLNGALRLSGQYSQSYSRELQEQAEALSRVTTASDTTIMKVQALLSSFGATKEEMPGLTKAVLDFAAGTGKDVVTAAQDLGKAISGQESSLSNLGMKFDKTAGQGKNLSQAAELIESKFKGMAEAADHSSGAKVEDLDKAWEHFKTTLGGLAADGLKPVIEGVTLLLNQTSDLFKEGSQASEYAKYFIEFAAGVAATTAAINTFKMGWQLASGAAIQEIGALRGVLGALPQAIPIAITVAATIQVIRAVQEGVAMKKAFDQEKNSVDQGLGGADKQRQGLQNEIQKYLQEHPEEKHKVAGWFGLIGDNFQDTGDSQTDLESRQRVLKSVREGLVRNQQRFSAASKTSTAATASAADPTDPFSVGDFGFGVQDPLGPQLPIPLDTNAGSDTAIQQAQATEQKITEIKKENLQVRQQDTEQCCADEQQANAAAQTAIATATDQTTTKIKANNQAQKQSFEDIDAEVKKIAVTAENSFASGLSHAFMSIIDGSKSAGDAFKDFAKSFLSQIAEMIMQMLILDALKSVLAFGDGGQAASPAAKGGMFPFTAAATGVMLAAAGVQGVNDVNGPTYFPKFNVLAGEAGHEVMTVMAKPQMGNIDGMPVILGNVGPEKLAVLSQANLSRMVQGSGKATFAASGYMTAGVSETGLSVSRQTNQPDGRIVVELTPHPAYETRIIENSIQGARVAVASDLATDTPIRNQVKSVFS
ncbi:hypothetical protein [Pedosphaera parvula]|uniref:Bacteriophage tail tape measure C-terminal domain-containing protein n=1 Tax=Pedosphaera parvula (strain Ellin514) TaxID=320771 RepID=B9XDF7_PEDPL|nr:hypothetical protein [Pedosphaera parvula]EEF62103.1 hypothetical protein Cflav_PD6378 [Pedosphaera parvula Ellin514]